MFKFSWTGKQVKRKFSNLRRKSLGVIAIEVCFTLPVVIYLIFFTIELIKINITNDALQSICEEATYLTITHDYDSYSEWVQKIDDIIEKYRPTFIPEKAPGYTSAPWPVIRYEIILYNGLNEMLATIPYGGHSIHYSKVEIDDAARLHYSFSSDSEFIPISGMEYNGPVQQWKVGERWYNNQINPMNYVFVLTFSCNYPFSSSLVKWLFNGGVNTVIGKESTGYNGIAKGEKGTKYILWTRGTGIVNAK